jgi:uncharacterized protein YfaP (DUF2135 family)
VATTDAAELHKVLAELRAAFHEHTKRLRKLAFVIPLRRSGDLVCDFGL